MFNDQLKELDMTSRVTLKDAIRRIEKALSYGDDMRSSSYLNITDAIALLESVKKNMESL